jgi:hypothetical protein
VTTTAAPDRFAAARAVADAVLYEGYVLYPYRASAAKNQLRWPFGVLVPPAFAAADRSERSHLRTECVVEAGRAPSLTVRVRFLQAQHRAVELAAADGFVPTERLAVDGTVWVPWDEGLEHVVDLGPFEVSGGADSTGRVYRVPAGEDVELLRSAEGAVAGRLVRRREELSARLRCTVDPIPGPEPLLRVSVMVENTSSWSAAPARRDAALARSLAATHVALAVDGGAFVSAIDPPAHARAAVAGCHQDGWFPVLVGPPGADDVVLAAPIILYDHPEIAPESPGDLYDSTEIDEILALRVLTLTDEEKAEARGTDARAAAVIDRCDELPPELWERLHGAIRSLGPVPAAPAAPVASREPDFPTWTTPGEAVPWWDPAADASVDPWSDSVVVAGVRLAAGSPVVLRPSRRADAQDLFLAGLDATVAGVFRDVDGGLHVAVTVDGEVGAALAGQGRHLFFHPDEVEPR